MTAADYQLLAMLAATDETRAQLVVALTREDN